MSMQRGALHALKHGHDCPLPVVSFWEHERARAVKDLKKVLVVFW